MKFFLKGQEAKNLQRQWVIPLKLSFSFLVDVCSSEWMWPHGAIWMRMTGTLHKVQDICIGTTFLPFQSQFNHSLFCLIQFETFPPGVWTVPSFQISIAWLPSEISWAVLCSSRSSNQAAKHGSSLGTEPDGSLPVLPATWMIDYHISNFAVFI